MDKFDDDLTFGHCNDGEGIVNFPILKSLRTLSLVKCENLSRYPLVNIQQTMENHNF